MERCKLHGAHRMKLPKTDDKKGRHKIKFAKNECQLRLPFVIYADFESVVRKQDSCVPSSSKFHHPIPTSRTIWELHLYEMQ